MPELARYIRNKPRMFVPEASDKAPDSSMYVLSQFSMTVQVDILEFVQSAEKVVHPLLPKLYGHKEKATKEFLAQLTTPERL
ncbi:hypothetical protein KXD40_008906 [Peronospora effusa]|uniref:Uncharacterized protein n=1 Tax=Peronospora effusa TaxID=542832 RepID=A0A3M6VNA0_9STRA|nr:hypothetical protein DD238_005482 [Peronospora effusa]RQM12407.1 hypothetical protein DD237_001000 [Peronospora effusa]UIZ22030.1 hypothetical protein KXD40_008906 [Peronospora effusa]